MVGVAELLGCIGESSFDGGGYKADPGCEFSAVLLQALVHRKVEDGFVGGKQGVSSRV